MDRSLRSLDLASSTLPLEEEEPVEKSYAAAQGFQNWWGCRGRLPSAKMESFGRCPAEEGDF